MIPCSQSEPDLIDLLQATAKFLWKDWPKDMDISSVSERAFTFNGTCPHCGRAAAFPSVTTPHDESSSPYNYSNGAKRIAALQCIACNRYILGIIKLNYGRDSRQWDYEAHYPLGKPRDDVDNSIPEDVASDFKEALRCRHVNAYNATIEMCRRAIEGSCIQLGAKPELVCNDMIEWVFKQGRITDSLRIMAQKIKLGGNRAAHAHSDRTLTDQDADAVVAFTKDYFHHVYVMPAMMDKFNFDKPGKDKPTK
jgi:hypothetical protein